MYINGFHVNRSTEMFPWPPTHGTGCFHFLPLGSPSGFFFSLYESVWRSPVFCVSSHSSFRKAGFSPFSPYLPSLSSDTSGLRLICLLFGSSSVPRGFSSPRSSRDSRERLPDPHSSLSPCPPSSFFYLFILPCLTLLHTFFLIFLSLSHPRHDYCHGQFSARRLQAGDW